MLLTSFLLFFVYLDTRIDKCYLTVENGVCKNELFGVYKKSVCCCTIGKAFSTCEKCPAKNTEEYTRLCKRVGHVNIDNLPIGKYDELINKIFFFKKMINQKKIKTNVHYSQIFVKMEFAEIQSVVLNVFVMMAMKSMTRD